MSNEKLFAAVLGLPPKDRARLAHQLLVSLDDDEGEADPGWGEAWRSEIDKRLREIRAGKVALEDGPTVLREIEAELDGRRTRKHRTRTKPRRPRRAK